MEYCHQNFDPKMVALGCSGLDWDFENRHQFYKHALPKLF